MITATNQWWANKHFEFWTYEILIHLQHYAELEIIDIFEKFGRFNISRSYKTEW